jgi:hypothetical protein
VRKFNKCTARGKVTRKREKKVRRQDTEYNYKGLYDHTNHDQYDEKQFIFSDYMILLKKGDRFNTSNKTNILKNFLKKNRLIYTTR